MNIINIVLPIFLVIGLGAFLGRVKKLNIDNFVFVIMYITSPCLTLASLQKSEVNTANFFSIITSAFIIVLGLFLVSTIILKFVKVKEKGIQLPMIFGNTGYLGFPVSLFAFGIVGLSYAVVYSAIETLIMMSLGICLAHHKHNFKEIFRLPLIYAVVFALLLNIIGYKLPSLALIPIDMVGQITIPLALIVLGYRLAGVKVKQAGKAFFAAFFKIGLGFLIALLAVTMFSITGMARNILILEAAMPSAVFTMILAHKYRRDSSLVASVVLVGTLISMLTIPLIILFIGKGF